MPPITAVLFDYGLVLTGPPDPAAWERLKARLGAPEDAFHTAYWRHRHNYDRGALNGTTYWAAVAADLGRSPDEPTIAALQDDDTALWTAPNQPMIDWAAALQRTGITTGILSNLGDAMERGVRARCGWLRHFHHHTFSHNLFIAKPDPAIYAHAAAGLGTPPAQILFIDDRADNIAAARAAGMQTLQYTTHDAFLQTMQQSGWQHLLNLEKLEPKFTEVT